MSFILEISGDLACFTRPELKVERVSYPVITPSAARNILMAILWKPAIRWRVLKIEILKPIKWTNIRRNEVGTKMSERSGSLYIECSRSRILGNVTVKSENSEKSVISHFKRILTANFEKRKRPLN